MRNFIGLLRDRWKLIVAVTLLACVVSGALSLRMTPKYAASVTLYVTDQTKTTDPSDAYQGALLSQQDVQSYADLLNGPMLANAVIKNLGLSITPAQLEASITARAVPQTVLLTATVTNSSAYTAQEIANSIGTEFGYLVASLERPAGGGAPSVRATVVAPAALPTSPVSPQPIRNIGIAVIVGLLAGIGLAAARRALDTTIKTPEQLAQVTGSAPLLGMVPYDTAARKYPLAAISQSSLPRLEAFRKIRTNLQFIDVDQPRKVLMFTSARPEEGKSSTVCNLAVLLAEAGRSVLVLECDLHRPRTGDYLGLPTAAGMSDVLAGRCDLEDAVQRWGDGLFDVLTSGTLPPNPSDLLGSRRMTTLVDRLRDRYDVVLVDAPPVLPFADAAVTVAVCDGAVLIARHGKAKSENVSQAVAELAAVNAPILGTVLSMTPRSAVPTYGYPYRHEPTRVTGAVTDTTAPPPEEDSDVLASSPAAAFFATKR